MSNAQALPKFSEEYESTLRFAGMFNGGEIQFREIIDTLPAAVYATDSVGRITYFNAACIRLSGRMPKIGSDQWCMAWKLFWPDGRLMRHEESPMAFAVQEGRSVNDGIEVGAERPDGSMIWFSPYSIPLRDSAGHIIGAIHMLVDVTKKRYSEQALIASEQRLRAFTTATSDVVYRMSPDWSELRQLYGQEFVPDTIEASSTWLNIYIYPGDQALVMAAAKDAITRKGVFELEHRVIRADGSVGWAHSRAVPILDNEGRILEWFGTASDVTRRKEAEESLAHQRRLYEGVLSTTPDLAYIFDLNHRFIYANEGLLKMWGKTWEEAIGKTCLELGYEPWHAEMHDREIEQVVATKQPIRGVVPFSGTFGRRLYDYIFTPVLDANGEVQAVAGTTRDVTEIKQTEEALRDSEARLARELADMKRLHELSLRLGEQRDLHEVMREVMEAAGELLDAEFSTAQLLDHQSEALQLVAVRGFDEDFAAEFVKVTRDGFTTCAAALRARRQVIVDDLSSNSDFTLLSSRVTALGIKSAISTPLLSGEGALLGVFTTYWKRSHVPSEHQLRLLDLYVQQAARQVERHTHEQALLESHRRKDEFLATLAHELRNPLAPIRSGLDVMRLAKSDSAKTEEIRGTMVRQTEQLVRLIDDLLDVSRITRGRLELKRREVELKEVVQSAVEATRPYIDEKGHELTISLPAEPLIIEADPHRLTQVLSNLLHNAAKYSPNSGRIEVRALREQDGITLLVKDQGLGIPPDKLNEVFEMFAQIGRNGQSGYSGLGIGLTLAKSLVEMHGGTIEVESEGLNRGAEFRVRIPGCVRRKENGDMQQLGEVEQRQKVQKRVLIVDDNQDAARILSLAVEFLGSEVRVAHDGVEALDLIAEFRPDVVLLDLGMPRMDGYEAARRIRELPWGADTMLVALTGWGQEEDKRRTKEAGFDDHLVKPADLDALSVILAADDAGR